MAEWKIIGLGAVINAALTVLLIVIFFPIFFIGPVVGGFLSSYFSHGYEDYDKMDLKDGFVIGTFSGIIGGLIITLLLIIGFGAISFIINIIPLKMEVLGANALVVAYIILQFSLIISTILSAIGGAIGAEVKDQ